MLRYFRVCGPLFAMFVACCMVGAAYQEAGQKGSADATFVQKASESNLVEIALGELAARQASNPRVKEFGSKMATDHGKVSKELADVASKNGIKVTTVMSKSHRDMIDNMSKRQGADFDSEYMNHQVKAHEASKTLFSNQAKNGQNADVKAFASKTLPVIEEHLNMAREVAKSVKK
jgi:putative membrane protein